MRCAAVVYACARSRDVDAERWSANSARNVDSIEIVGRAVFLAMKGCTESWAGDAIMRVR